MVTAMTNGKGTTRDAHTASGRDQFRGFLDAIPDLTFVLDDSGRYLEVLGSDASLLYAGAKDLLGRRMRQVLPRFKADQFLRTVRTTLRTGESQILEYELDVPAGRRFFEGRTAPLSKRVRGRRTVVWVSRDITERKNLEARLRSQMTETRRAYQELRRTQAQLIRSEKLASIGALLAGVAHEMNNPINVMYGNLQLLTDMMGSKGDRPPDAKPRSGARVRQMLRDALNAGRRAQAAMTQFRSFARDIREADFIDLNSCVADAAGHVLRDRHSRVRVVQRLGRLVPVRCFPGQIRMLFTNLIQNAVDACKGGGSVTLRTKMAGRAVVFEVSDTGPGIPRMHRKNLFQPFFTTKTPGQGLGLGLAVSAMIVDQHKGRIACRSTPGEGTTFRVKLPVGK
ncbi:MAG: PAS domain-containing sensor histidine kinase [Planctomycetaceae bacterium]|nr:PAS domain-containing sensor histidine kinase [Planctomycetaceae bacterium]